MAHRSNQSSIPGINSNNGIVTIQILIFYTLIDTINYLPLINSSLIDSGIIIPNIPIKFITHFLILGS